jgi:ketosteroid isomerase-like protein
MLRRTMSEESTTAGLVEHVRRCFEAISAGDLDAAQPFFTHDAVLDMTWTTGVVVHGLDAIRAFQEDWLAGYEEVAYTAEEVIDAGEGCADRASYGHDRSRYPAGGPHLDHRGRVLRSRDRLPKLRHAESRMTLDVYPQLLDRRKRDHGVAFDALLADARCTLYGPQNEGFGPPFGPLKPRQAQSGF